MPFRNQASVWLIFPDRRSEHIAKDVVNVVFAIYDNVSHVEHCVEEGLVIHFRGGPDAPEHSSLSVEDRHQIVRWESADKDPPILQCSHAMRSFKCKRTQQLSACCKYLYI